MQNMWKHVSAVKRTDKERRGFTLLELVLSVALFAVLVGAGYPVYQSFASRADLNQATETVVHALRRTQLLARSGAGDSAWGLDIAPSRLVIFRGENYGIRDQAFDERFELSDNVMASGVLDVVFTRFSGEPIGVGAVTLIVPLGQGTRLISWNAKGVIAY